LERNAATYISKQQTQLTVPHFGKISKDFKYRQVMTIHQQQVFYKTTNALEKTLLILAAKVKVADPCGRTV
jgi:hypothetical protein